MGKRFFVHGKHERAAMPRMPEPSYVACTRAACERQGTVDPDAAEWIGPMIAQGMREGWGDVHRRFRSQGELLSRDELKSLGLASNMKLGRRFWDVLTRKGRKDPVGAASALFSDVISAYDRMETLRRAAQLGVPVRLLLGGDPFTQCRTIKRFRKALMKAEEAPALPLPECRAEWCGCTFICEP